jgi:predicted AlkP superfamily phosphohydrolase/phosphomutase
VTVRVLLIGLDGATFRVLDPLMRDGEMPFLRGLVESGARAELRSVIPALTPPAWTSLATGRSPGRHGILDFFRKTAPSSSHIRFLGGDDVSVETVWSIAHRKGLRSTVLNFPVTFPAPRIDGYVVPGWMPWKQLRAACRPRELYDRLKTLPGFDVRELAMDMGFEEKAIEGCRLEETVDWVELHVRRERQWLKIATTLMEEDPTELVAVLFDGVDKLQHLCWRFIDPTMAGDDDSPEGRRIREACLGYFRELDRILAELVERAGPSARVVIASDHGFGPQSATFFVNEWLERRGHLRWAADRAPQVTEEATLGVGQLARHVYLLDWSHTRAYAPTPSGNGIHIVTASDETPGGVAPEDYEAFRAKLVDELYKLVHPVTGDRLVTRAWTREEVFEGPFLDVAPDLTLELSDGGLVSILDAPADAAEPVIERPLPAGTHRPEGILVVGGDGVSKGARLVERPIVDVASIVLHGLGLEIPADLEGEVPSGLYTFSHLQAAPVRTGEKTRVVGDAPTDEPAPELDAEGEAQIVARLRALGYVD